MIALVLREFHQFQASGRQFLYLVPSAAVFELDATGAAVLLQLAGARQTEDAVVDALSGRFPAPACSRRSASSWTSAPSRTSTSQTRKRRACFR